MPSRQHAAATAKAALAIVASLEVPPERIPGPEAVRAAWLRLNPDVQARIGSAALGFAFNAWLSADGDRESADRWLTDAAVCGAVVASDEALNRLLGTAEATVPELFGTTEDEPAWVRGGVIVPFPQGAAASPQLRQAITEFQGAVLALSEAAEASGLSIEADELDALSRAEYAAFDAVLTVPVTSRADMVAMLGHVGSGVDYANPTDSLSMAVQMLRRLLDAEASVHTAPPIVTAPLAVAIAEHHRAFTAMHAGHAEGWASGDPTDAWLALSRAEDAAFKAVLAAPCSGRADAMAFIGHVYPLVAEGPTRHPVLNDMGDEACRVAARVLEVFSAVLAEDGEPGEVRGRLS